MTETPRYRLHAPTLIAGVYFDQQHIPAEVDLPASVEPRNSFEPLNEAARDVFRARDARKLKELDAEIAEAVAEVEELKKAGAGEAELEGFNSQLSKLRLARALMPKALKAVPTFGGAKPTHSLAFGAKPPSESETKIEAAKQAGATDEQLVALRLESILNSAIAGGASDADVAALKKAFGATEPAAVAVAKAAENKASLREQAERKVEPKKPDEPKRAPRLND